MELNLAIIIVLSAALLSMFVFLFFAFRRGTDSYQAKYSELTLRYTELKKKYEELVTHNETLRKLFDQQAGAAMTSDAAQAAMQDRLLGLRNNYDSLLRDSAGQQTAILAMGRQMGEMAIRIADLELSLAASRSALSRLQGETGKE